MNLLFSIFLLVIFIEAWPVCNAKIPDCRNIFQFNFDETNRVESGSLNFLLEEEFNFVDVELEFVFGFKTLPVNDEDVPRLSLTGRELMLGYGQNITFDLLFNLERRIPPIVRITAESNSSFKVLCQNVQHSKSFLQLRDSIVLEKQETTEISYEKPIYQCICSTNKFGDCYSWKFKNLNLNETHPHFEPVCDTFTSSVNKVFLEGQVHTLTDDMCDNFPEITHYIAESIGLESVHSNAFYECSQLVHLSLAHNNLITLHEHLFKNNPVLQELRLSYNKLSSFDGKLFKFTPALRELKLSHTFMTKFPFDNMPVLPNLKTLIMVNNTLCNLKEEKIIYKFPTLQTIYVSSEIRSKVKKSIESYNEKVSVIAWIW